ncbi:MAG TPA: two-component regulator propeller domain-containing protein [Acidobacteriaceae bacterium]|jgi:ligand-binding sensor domain-containing protein/signal transduction histidine kinase|nr:two-component regulator propeller domain-containing protein [Acidobacteriaceae bacterium]
MAPVRLGRGGDLDQGRLMKAALSKPLPLTRTGSRLRAFGVIFAAGIALAGMSARALDPHTALAQYGYQSWQTDTGLPQNTVHAMVQGPDGFLWIATEGGLVRFDGVGFRVMTHANTPELPSDLIDDLMLGRDGTLWVSTSGGLAWLRGGRLEAFGPDRGIPATQVWRTFEDGSGRVWALTAAGLFRIEGERAAAVPLDQDLTENSTMVAGRDGTLWLGTAEGLLRGTGAGRFRLVGASGEVLGLTVDREGTAWAGLRSGLEACTAAACRSVQTPNGGAVHALVADGTGQVWVATDAEVVSLRNGHWYGKPGTEGAQFLYCDRQGAVWAGTPQGLVRFTGQGDLETQQWRWGHDVYLAATEDREGDLWLGTEAGGLAVLRDRKFSTLGTQDGLNDEYALALAQAPDGAVWVGTKNGGVDVDRDGKFHAVTTAQGLVSNVVLAVAAAPNGDVWVGTPDGLNRIRGDEVRVFTTADGLADDFVRSLYVDGKGGLWVGTRHGLSRYANGAFTTWTAADGLGSDLVGAIRGDGSGGDGGGGLWIGTLGGLSHFRDGEFRNFTKKDGLSSNVVTSLHRDPDGTLWIGTNDGGLNRMRNGRIVAIHSEQLPVRVIGILADGSGSLWISSNTGIYRVNRAALDRMAGGGGSAEVLRFGVADGMQISECSSGGHPAALRLRDGELWFATLRGIARVHPETMPVNRVPPPVVIEQVDVDDAPQSSPATLAVAPGHSHYEFDYAGLSFVAPQKVEYRYQLVGFDKGWVDAGTRRTAYYTNLPHGHYTFRVMARNNDGVWSRAAATADLTVEPHMWQTWWFRVLLALALLTAAYGAWRRRLERVEREFQAVLGERARIAREIHDTLAQGFVAVSVHLELVAQLMRSSGEAAKQQLEHAQALVRSSLEDARMSIWELRSQATEREELATRMLRMAEDTVAREGSQARVQMRVAGTNHPLDASVERELARIAREAVVNAVRHGKARNILLRLEFDGSMFGMEIRDDGKGFAGSAPGPESGHFGVMGMGERAQAIGAELTVESAEGEGTRVHLKMPPDFTALETGKN